MGVCTQQLLPTRDGRGRCVACEVLVPTPAVRNLIRENKSHQIKTVIQMGGSTGMQTMEQALVDLVRRRVISRELAIQRASTPDEVVRQLDRGK
jgi:twitching motility protein PilT